MSLIKRISRSAPAQAGLCWLGAWYIRLVYLTGRWEVGGDEETRRLWDRGDAFILAFWHGRLLMMPYAWRRGVAIRMLISNHPDGQLIARTVRHFGIGWAAGSSTRGGAGALRTMIRALKAGESVGITPDGPKGPRMRAGDGAIALARLTGAPILPATFSASRAVQVGSWDRFLVALPFARGVFLWGRPIRVAERAGPGDMMQARHELEASLNDLTRDADRKCGRPPVEPAPLDRAGAA